MKYLLDVNVLLAAIWDAHPLHARAFNWMKEKNVVVCPLVELGFIRISADPKVFNLPMDRTRRMLDSFLRERKAHRIADDLPALESFATESKNVTDLYLSELAEKHHLKFATLDGKIKHFAAVLIL
jgi:predicted nucleic acid-binding protein